MLMRKLGVVGMLTFGTAAFADDPPYECDDRYNPCGAPEQSGGGGGGGGGSVLVNNTDLGETYQNADDYDDDGIEDPYDNCPWSYNPEQSDDDGDQVGTQCDNCPTTANADQLNLDGDLLGDTCDLDLDGDGIENQADLCVDHPDPLQKDTDGDSLGDACDDDMDNDGVANLADNCPLVQNPDQNNDDPDLWGNACDDDDDADGIRNTYDNCIWVSNAVQDNLDDDMLGDACDVDADGDSILDTVDNCPLKANADQLDLDRDGVGEECDDRYCFVVYGDLDNCLDPTDPFRAYLPNAEATVGDTLRLRLFANHSDQNVSYSFSVTSAPRGSRATVDNGVGSSSQSTPYEYNYDAGAEVLFTPDRPGDYVVQVDASVDGTDPVTGELNPTSTTTMQITVDGEAQGGCSVVGGSAAGLLFAPLLLVVTRRHR